MMEMMKTHNFLGLLMLIVAVAVAAVAVVVVVVDTNCPNCSQRWTFGRFVKS